jgi:DNA-binding NarL/FixJ family response regulator
MPKLLPSAWNQQLVEDRQAGPAEIAAARIDVAAWLGSLSKRHRRIAKALALGTSTSEVARQFGLCPARISQLRSWFRRHWEEFQGGVLPGGCVA